MTDTTTRWKARLRLALAEKSVDAETADAVLDEVELHCAQSGETPEDAFGAPEEYAAEVARERIPLEERSSRRWDGPTRSDLAFAALAQVGLAAVLSGVYLWVCDGTMLTVTPAGLAGTALTAIALLCACCAAGCARSRMRGALGWGVAALGAVLLAATAFTTLPGTSIGRLPAPSLCVLGVLLLWTAAGHEPDPNREQREVKAPTGPADWLTELPRLLEERHGLSRARASELTREAAHHLTATGHSAEEEFGPVEVYALRLAEEQTPPRAPWWTRDDIQAAVFTAVFATYLISSLSSRGPLWQTALAATALAIELALLATRLLRRRRTGSGAR
ncbi:hypothetical protein ACIQ6V_02845 [Streptomyces sp. NPDC096198]|uniref:hypothetical protein n=1 Tax=Streptomyces sp. NPDC096198 TaxID=3366080 RepID=UPI0038262F8C